MLEEKETTKEPEVSKSFDYMDDYDAFQANFRKTEVSGEEVGEIVMRMAGYFSRYNIRLGDAIRELSAVKSEFINQLDTNGKAISNAKAESLADATQEAETFVMARVHVNNIQEMINALKTLQKGLLIEYQNTT